MDRDSAEFDRAYWEKLRKLAESPQWAGTATSKWILGAGEPGDEGYLARLMETFVPDPSRVEAVRFNLTLTPDERIDQHRRACENYLTLREAYDNSRSGRSRKSA